VSNLTKVKAIGLCHGVFGGFGGACRILEKSGDELEFIAGGLNHFFWVLRLADKKTGEDLYPALRNRILTDPDCPAAPPLVKKMVEVFGCYTYPSDDHIGEYLSFAHEFTGLKWHYGQESEPVGREEPPKWQSYLEPCVGGEKPLDDGILRESGEIGIPIVLSIETNTKFNALAVNVPNTGGYVEELTPDTIVEVPAIVDGSGVHPQKLPAMPEALAAFCRTQASIQKLLVQAYKERSKKLLLQALLVDPVVDSVSSAEQMLDYMLDLQKDYLPEFS